MGTELNNLADEVKLIAMTYGIEGTLVSIDGVYGFIRKDSKIRFIDTVNKRSLTDEYYSLTYKDADIMIIGRNNEYFKHTSLIIDLKTYNILYETTAYLFVEGDLIFESIEDISMTSRFTYILDKKANLVYAYEALSDINLVCLNSNGLYLLKYKMPYEELKPINEKDNIHPDFKYFEILKHSNNTVKSLYRSKDYEVETINDGVVLFTNINDLTDIYVYDFIDGKIVSENNL